MRVHHTAALLSLLLAAGAVASVPSAAGAGPGAPPDAAIARATPRAGPGEPSPSDAAVTHATARAGLARVQPPPGAAAPAATPGPTGAAAPAPPQGWRDALGARVAEADAALPGALSVYVRDVASGETWGYGADAPSYLSSAVKVAVALTVLHAVDTGQLPLAHRVRFGAEDVRDGVGPLGPPDVGRQLTVGQLLELMLVHSDNAAADVLIREVGGAPALEAHLAARGVRFGPLRSLLGERHVLYGLLDPRGRLLDGEQLRALGGHAHLGARAAAFGALLFDAPLYGEADLVRAFERFYATGVNAAPMAQVGELLAQAARCDGLSADSCTRLHALMRACRTGRARVRAGLPADVPWAHKTGTQLRRACDVGFFDAPGGRRVVVAACARDFRQVAEAEAAFARVGAAAWEALGGPPAAASADATPLPGAVR